MSDDMELEEIRMVHSDSNEHINHENVKKQNFKYSYENIIMIISIIMSFIAIIVGGRALVITRSYKNNQPSPSPLPSPSIVSNRFVKKLAFGSCTSYDYRPQKIWDTIISSDLDAWIWAGDFIYFDLPPLNCEIHPSSEFCNCTRSWIRKNNCGEGNINNAMLRVHGQLQHDDYLKFIKFMCPNQTFMPPSDQMNCERSISGVYDDHDFGWNNGDRRLPNKYVFKQLFLDTIGVPKTSSRRNGGRGIEFSYKYNSGMSKEEINVIMLDERFYRPPLPCHIRRDYCEKIVLPNVDNWDYPWCLDFLHGDNTGSCCNWDDKIEKDWCINNQDHELYEEACDATSDKFGFRSLEFNESGQLNPVSNREDRYLIDDDNISDAPFCDVLGKSQRKWLKNELDKSTSLLNIIVSGSVAINNPSPRLCNPNIENVTCTCGSDDFDCYSPAQINLFSMLQNSMKKDHNPGCVVIFTGDYHISDIKVIEPGSHTKYAPYVKSHDWKYPIYQIMASGLTKSTAKYYPCDNTTWTYDHLGLRVDGACNYMNNEPSYGMVDIDWNLDDPIVHLQIRNVNNEITIEKSFALSTCR